MKVGRSHEKADVPRSQADRLLADDADHFCRFTWRGFRGQIARDTAQATHEVSVGTIPVTPNFPPPESGP